MTDIYKRIKLLPNELQSYIYEYVSYKKEYDSVIEEYKKLLFQILNTEEIVIKKNMYCSKKCTRIGENILVSTNVGNIFYIENHDDPNQIIYIDFLLVSKCILQVLKKVPFNFDKYESYMTMIEYKDYFGFLFVWSSFIFGCILLIIVLDVLS